MARFRKIMVSTWGDDRFRQLTQIPPCGQGLWFWLLTNPETTSIPGLFRAGEAGQAEALGWTLEAFREAFREVSLKGMAKADWKARVVWIPKAIEHNKPESPNVVRGWRIPWDEIPECELKVEAYQALKAFMKGLSKGYGEALTESLRPPGARPSPNQEQEQEQEQDIKTHTPRDAETEKAIAAKHVSQLTCPKVLADSTRCKKQLIDWQVVRFRSHGSFTDPISWEATAMKWAAWSEEKWFAAFCLSTQVSSLNICNPDIDHQKRSKGQAGVNGRTGKPAPQYRDLTDDIEQTRLLKIQRAKEREAIENAK